MPEEFEHDLIGVLQEHYGNNFDYVLCHNNISSKDMDLLSNLGVELFNQEVNANYFNGSPKSSIWKICPPSCRSRLNRYRVFNTRTYGCAA